MTIAEAHRQAQLALEHLRTMLDHGTEDTNDIDALNDAETARDIAWLTACTGPPPEHSTPSPSTEPPRSTLS